MSEFDEMLSVKFRAGVCKRDADTQTKHKRMSAITVTLVGHAEYNKNKAKVAVTVDVPSMVRFCILFISKLL